MLLKKLYDENYENRVTLEQEGKKYVVKFRGKEAYGKSKKEALELGYWLVLSELYEVEAKCNKLDGDVEKLEKIKEVLLYASP